MSENRSNERKQRKTHIIRKFEITFSVTLLKMVFSLSAQ